MFTPHLSEYSRLPPGQYTEGTFIITDIEEVYNREGKKVHTGAPFLKAGDDVLASLVLLKMLWVGNIFRDTGVPILSTRPQFCRGIQGLGWQQGTFNVVARDTTAGQASGGTGLTDFFGLCGIYGDEHTWGPLKANGLLATTLKVPIGRYDTDALLNVGTNYWSVIPQLAAHAELYGRLYFDGTVAWQINGDNRSPAFGGLTPTQPADVMNYEGNFAWKFSEHWFVDVGLSYRHTLGNNRYEKYTLSLKDQPVQPQDACNNTNNGLGLEVVDQDLCNSASFFFISPRPGPYEDRGIQGTLLTAGVYYIYRTSTVLQARIAQPIAGRGGQIDAVYDVCTQQPCPGPDNNGNGTGDNSLTTTRSTQNAVQEAAAVSASPYLELRFVYLFWAP